MGAPVKKQKDEPAKKQKALPAKKKEILTMDMIESMTVNELKVKCKSFGLKQTGIKKELQERLQQTAYFKKGKGRKKKERAVKIAKAVIKSKKKPAKKKEADPVIKLTSDGKVDK